MCVCHLLLVVVLCRWDVHFLRVMLELRRQCDCWIHFFPAASSANCMICLLPCWLVRCGNLYYVPCCVLRWHACSGREVFSEWLRFLASVSCRVYTHAKCHSADFNSDYRRCWMSVLLNSIYSLSRWPYRDSVSVLSAVLVKGPCALAGRFFLIFITGENSSLMSHRKHFSTWQQRKQAFLVAVIRFSSIRSICGSAIFPLMFR